MKKYRLDENPRFPQPIFDDEDDRGEHPNRIWVEQIVKIFGETHYTEQYSLMSRNKLKRIKLWKSQKPKNPLLPQKSNTQINFTSVLPLRD